MNTKLADKIEEERIPARYEGMGIKYLTDEEVQAIIESHPEYISSQLIQRCDCKEFKHYETLTFDSQDLYELGYEECPYCKKPFKKRNEI